MKPRVSLEQETLVSLEEFLNTYRFGSSYYNAYVEAVSTDAKSTAIADRHNTSSSIVRYWRKGEKIPDSIKATNIANRLELFPLSYVNNRFPPINMLAAWVTYSGRCDIQKFRPVLYGGPLELEFFMEELAPLGIMGEYDTRLYGVSLKGNGIGALFGRVLNLLEVNNRQMDIDAELKLPPYIQNLINWQNSGVLHGGDKQTARKLLFDFTTILFATKLIINRERGYQWYIDLPKKNDRTHAESEGKQTIELLQHALPDVDIDSDRDLRIYPSNTQSSRLSSARVWLYRDTIIDLLERHRDLFRFTPSILTRYMDRLKRHRSLRPRLLKAVISEAEKREYVEPQVFEGRLKDIEYREQREQAVTDNLIRFDGDRRKTAEVLCLTDGELLLYMKRYGLISDEELTDIIKANLRANRGFIRRSSSDLGISEYHYSKLLKTLGIDHMQYRIAI
ncbi:MAG: hypothetical protein HYS62_01510 [Candidatus Aenigmarchaeota archaeon]|nr:hypothetical protein [Candidatus Aenigmarchaeota archaeon]